MKRSAPLFLVDFFSWVLAVLVAVFFRYDFNVAEIFGWHFIALGAFSGTVVLGVGQAVGLYRLRHRPGSFNELTILALATVLSATPTATLILLFGVSWDIPRSIPLIATPLFFITAVGARTANRLRRSSSKRNGNGQPVLIYGAGDMAEKLIPQLLEDPQSSFLPVGLLDDDPRRSNRWISGVKMFGTFDELPEIVSKHRVTGIVVAIPRASAEMLREIRRIAIPLGLKIYVLPTFSEILKNFDNRLALRDLTVEDLVGRRSIQVNSSSIDSMFRGKRVLVTGAGGSIGLELCKQVANFQPSRLIMLDRDDTALQQAQLQTQNSGLLTSPNLILADIRDSELLDKIWDDSKPEVVLHGAALKHLTLLEAHPDEAWKTNVEGTLNVLNASLRSGVTTLVNISTDKAADPSSVLGKSKRVAEQLTSWAATQIEGKYISVRFGNVLGSRGSLVPTLAHLLEKDLPITITHPEATRYFMTIPEACQLVLEAATQDSDDSIFVLDMGSPIKILDLASRMIELSGKHAEIIYTGLRPGEKLHERLHSEGEQLAKGEHELIFRAKSSAIYPSELALIRKSWEKSEATMFSRNPD